MALEELRQGDSSGRPQLEEARDRFNKMLDQSGAALDPITVIAIKDAVHLANLGVMDVATDDTVDAATGRLGGYGIGE